MNSYQRGLVFPYSFIHVGFIFEHSFPFSRWVFGVVSSVPWYSASKMNHHQQRQYFVSWDLISVGYGSSLGSPDGGNPVGRTTPSRTPPMNNSKKRVDHPSSTVRSSLDGNRISSKDWWQNSWSTPTVNCGYFRTWVWRVGTAAAWGPGRTGDAGCPDGTMPACVPTTTDGGMLGVHGWYWKHARSTHWSNVLVVEQVEHDLNPNPFSMG